MRALSQTRELYSTQMEEWRTLMENALPWNKKPVKDARDTQIKQLEHEILRKGALFSSNRGMAYTHGECFTMEQEAR